MYYVIIDNITIIYSDKEKLCISKIIKYIKNNMDFFKSYQNKTLSFVPLEDEDTYYIDEFDFFFARIIRDFVDDPEVEILFKNHDFPMLIVKLLFCIIKQNVTITFFSKTL